MGTSKRIAEYRARLDKTLQSPDLMNTDTLKALIRDHLRHSSLDTREVCSKDLAERTVEVSNFLDMLRSASVDSSSLKSGHTSHGEWKLQHDTEEFRVMYREGPKGTPFHTLLVEGYVDGPVDACLCISWESALYQKWWPQYNMPTFKITSSQCLHKIRIGEQISLVRVKLSWPLSAREALIHYLEFEYPKDDLIIVLLNSISESDSIDENSHGYTREMIPDTKDVIRIGFVGGFALQKVTSERSYFRTIANIDLKLDFVPPSLINFISRQLIGSGFRLYQKAVATVFDSDKDFKKALVNPLYDRIRKALCIKEKENGMVQIEELSTVEENKLEEDIMQASHYDLNEIVQDLQKDNIALESPPQPISGNKKIKFEIEEVESEEDGTKEITNHVSHWENIHVAREHYIDDKRKVCVSPEVERAIGTLEKVITLVREYRLNTYAGSSCSSSFSEEEPEDVGKDAAKNSIPEGVENEVCVEVPDEANVERIPDGLRQSSSTLSSRLKSDSGAREVNHYKIAPVSPEERALVPEHSDSVALEIRREDRQTSDMTTKSGNGTQVGLRCDEVNGMDTAKRSSRRRRYGFCCFHGVTRD